MDEPVTRPDLSSEQQNTAALIRQLLGKSIADRYVDCCRLSSGAIPIRVSIPVAAHAMRELESILRQTLAGPMDISVATSAEDTARSDAARKQLRSIGFGDDAIQRAVKELQPRLSHKAQSQAIVTRLGLAVDSDIAQAWTSIAGAHGKAHDRPHYQSLAVDDEFRADWQRPFDTVVRGLMVALQGKYVALMQRVDQLAVMPDRAAAVKSFVKEIPGALPLLWHFFNQLHTPDWLPHLAKHNLLAGPATPPEEDAADALLLRQWPAGRYLLRMARMPDASARAKVVAALRNVGTSRHPDVQQMGMEVLAALPADDAAPLVDLAEAWLSREARFVMAQGPHDLIKVLAQGGHGSAALRVARRLFQVFDDGGRLGTLFGRHMYEHHLPDAVRALAPACGVETVALLCNLLDQAVRISRKVGDDPPSDYTYYISGQISEHGTKHDVIEGLVGGIVLAAKLSIEANASCTRDVVQQIKGHSPKIFVRLALHVLSLSPAAAADLAEAYLADGDLIEASWCRAEYAELARAWFPSLPADVGQRILAFVDATPDKYRAGWNQRFEAHEKRAPTPDDERKYNASVVRDLLWSWQSVLPADRQAALKATADELGDPDAWRRAFDQPEVPVPVEVGLSAAPVDEIIAFLKTWRPASAEKRQTATALAQRVRNAAIDNPALYSTNALRFAELPLLYVRAVLEGLENVSNNRQALDWTGALALMVSVMESGLAPSSIEGDDTDPLWCRKAAAALLASGLRQGAQGIPSARSDLVTKLVFAFHQSAPRRPETETETFEESYRSFPYYGAQGTARGAAVELLILLLFWLSKDDDSVVGKAPNAAIENLPELKAILEAELQDVSSDGRIPRAIMGRYLTWLFYFGEGWLRSHMAALFPSDDAMLRDAAWVSHLGTDSSPIKDLAPAMRDCYVAEIQRIGKGQGISDQQHIEERLAHYLVILYIWSALPDDVFELFWDTAPASSRVSAMWFLGTQLELTREQLPDNLRTRAYSYWDRRLAAARASTNLDHFREELGAIGQFFIRKNIDATWLMSQVLAMADGGFAPSESYSVLDRLSKLSPEHPERAVEVLSALVRNPRFDRWVYMTQQNEVRSILENGLATGSDKVRSLATETISYLAALGDGGYLALLPKPE